MSSMRELYQEMIIDHSRSPRNHRKLEESNRSARGTAPTRRGTAPAHWHRDLLHLLTFTYMDPS